MDTLIREKMTPSLQNLDYVQDYYCSPRTVGDSTMSVYEIWEKGQAFNDSITPAIYNPEYRSHIVLKLISLTKEQDNIFSIGCGNGFVEQELIQCGRQVKAIDCNKQAVELARKKGVDASIADFYQLPAESLAHMDIIYADGLIGHLFHEAEALKPALDKLKNFHLKPGVYLIFSNDAPKDTQIAFSPHERVRGFWFVSKDYLQQNLLDYGFEPVENYYFPYFRPISGLKNRSICIVKVSIG
jgi:SAM-dependent methyltransferase